MPRPRNIFPTYRRHSSGRAAMSIFRTDGSRTEVLLPGKYGSEVSRQQYERLLAQLRAHGGNLPSDLTRVINDMTVTELILKFIEKRVFPYYVDPITKEPTREQKNFGHRCAR